MVAAHDTDEVLDLIVNENARLVDTSAAYIRLLEGDLLVPKAATQLLSEIVTNIEEDGLELKVGERFMGQVMTTKAPLTSEDVSRDERADPLGRSYVESSGMHGGAVVPLLANDQSIGVLAVMDTRIRRFNDRVDGRRRS